MEDLLIFLHQVIDALSPTAFLSYWEATKQFFSDLMYWCLIFFAFFVAIGVSGAGAGGSSTGICPHCGYVINPTKGRCGNCGLSLL